MPVNFSGSSIPSSVFNAFTLPSQGGSTLGSVSTAVGPFMQPRADVNVTPGGGWGTDDVPGLCLPFYVSSRRTFNTLAINHTTGTHPSAVLEAAIYLPNTSNYLPDSFVNKVSFPLSATGNKTQTLSTPFSVNGLFWICTRQTLGDTNFKAGGNGVGLNLVGCFSYHNTFLSFLFGFGPASSGVSQYFGCLYPSRNPLFTTLPTGSILSEITLSQGSNAGAPHVLIY